jgi:hypothetical protein
MRGMNVEKNLLKNLLKYLGKYQILPSYIGRGYHSQNQRRNDYHYHTAAFATFTMHHTNSCNLQETRASKRPGMSRVNHWVNQEKCPNDLVKQTCTGQLLYSLADITIVHSRTHIMMLSRHPHNSVPLYQVSRFCNTRLFNFKPHRAA